MYVDCHALRARNDGCLPLVIARSAATKQSIYDKAFVIARSERSERRGNPYMTKGIK